MRFIIIQWVKYKLMLVDSKIYNPSFQGFMDYLEQQMQKEAPISEEELL